MDLLCEVIKQVRESKGRPSVIGIPYAKVRMPRKKKKAYKKTFEGQLAGMVKKYKIAGDYFVIPEGAEIEFIQMNP